MTATDDAIRRYLTALHDPDALVDQSRLDTLREELAATSDPIRRLHLQQALIDVAEPDIASLEAAFIDTVRGWAAAEGITWKALAAEGVDRKVLARAGFPTGTKPAARGRRASRRVTRAQVTRRIPAGTFTVADLADATGASKATARLAIRDLIDQGRVVEKGTATDTGPGVAAKVYATA